MIFAPQVKGAGRWLNLGFITIQPADIAKLVLNNSSRLLDWKRKEKILLDFKNGFMYLVHLGFNYCRINFYSTQC